MPTICPKDGKACIDDICRGSGVCLATGLEMLERCNHCHQIYSDDVDCDCEWRTEDDYADNEDCG